jgi:hypothetical protein
MQHTLNPIDKAAMAVSGFLMVLGVVVLGIVEVLAGPPYGASAVEQTNEAGEVVNTIYPAVDPTIRTGLVILGLVVLLLWGVYKVVSPTLGEEQPRTTEMATD